MIKQNFPNTELSVMGEPESNLSTDDKLLAEIENVNFQATELRAKLAKCEGVASQLRQRLKAAESSKKILRKDISKYIRIVDSLRKERDIERRRAEMNEFKFTQLIKKSHETQGYSIIANIATGIGCSLIGSCVMEGNKYSTAGLAGGIVLVAIGLTLHGWLWITRPK